MHIDYISAKEIFEDGVFNDPQPYIKEIILSDNVNIIDDNDIIVLELNSGSIHKMGSIQEGTTISDYREYEISNQHSISLSLKPFKSWVVRTIVTLL